MAGHRQGMPRRFFAPQPAPSLSLYTHDADARLDLELVYLVVKLRAQGKTKGRPLGGLPVRAMPVELQTEATAPVANSAKQAST
jgi:hypothetical protein